MSVLNDRKRADPINQTCTLRWHVDRSAHEHQGCHGSAETRAQPHRPVRCCHPTRVAAPPNCSSSGPPHGLDRSPAVSRVVEPTSTLRGRSSFATAPKKPKTVARAREPSRDMVRRVSYLMSRRIYTFSFAAVAAERCAHVTSHRRTELCDSQKVQHSRVRSSCAQTWRTFRSPVVARFLLVVRS